MRSGKPGAGANVIARPHARSLPFPGETAYAFEKERVRAMGKVCGTLLLLLLLGVAAGRAHAAELVMFDDPTCVWCRRWLAEVGPGYPHTEEGRRAPLRRVDIGQQSRAGVALKTAVTATPTFVLVEAGAEVGRLTGYPGADYFYPMLGELLQKLPKEQPRPALRETRAEAASAR